MTDFVGNRTECALLVLLRKLGFDYKQLREEREADQIKVRVWLATAAVGAWEMTCTNWLGWA